MRWITTYIMVVAVVSMPSAGWSDSLFNQKTADSGTLISDNRLRFEVGDLITVLVRENVDARTRSELSTQKQSEIDAEAKPTDNTTFVGGAGLIDLAPGLLPNWNVKVDNSHEADGTTRRRNELTMTVACRVTRVWPNGNIEVEGSKRVTINRDDSLLVVSGMARTRDISAENTLDSNQLANAVIELRGRGPLWNNERRGIFTRLLDWISPF